MPGLDGHAVIAKLREAERTRDIPVIFLTGRDSMAEEQVGFDLGALDYIAKPVRPPILLARVHTHLELKRARDWLQDQNALLESEIVRRMTENQLIQDVSVHALAHLAEKRDPATICGAPKTLCECWREACRIIRASPPRCRTVPSRRWSNLRRCMISARSAFPTRFC
jgi:response regulator RpfG family c-di-GMP phosphodiesterase